MRAGVDGWYRFVFEVESALVCFFYLVLELEDLSSTQFVFEMRVATVKDLLHRCLHRLR